MHHQDLSGEPPGSGARRTAFHLRRGSSGTSSSSTAGAASLSADESCAQPGSSSPALHHQPQGPGTQGTQGPGTQGAQVKKKSGFQITSVTSAQINVSGNNSLADDTESYDDMDESHTEELSSSDLLDVSVSRATDTGVPGRSSSDETLNSLHGADTPGLHGADTPGLVSPNEHVLAHLPQVSSQVSPHVSPLVNGTENPHSYPLHQPAVHHEPVPGGEPSGPAMPGAPLASSSPHAVSKAGSFQSQRMPIFDSSKAAGGVPVDTDLQSSCVPPLCEPHVCMETGAAPSSHSQQPHTHTAPGSRFRVVKLDTNSEPFRKGRWTCTEYYEKEVPHSTASDAAKALDVPADTEVANVSISPAAPGPQPLQSYQPPNQDFTSPPAMPAPPLPYIPVQDGNMGLHLTKTQTPAAPPAVGQPPALLPQQLPQQLPYTVDPGAVYSAHLHTGVPVGGAVRQPDFIQPTAPFQSQVQPPLSHVPAVPLTPAVPAQPSVSLTQQLGAQTQGALFPTLQPANIPAPPLLLQPQPPLGQPHPVPAAPHPGAQAMPLTALQADLQPLLAPTAGLSLAPGAGRSSQLEDAHRLLFQHQGLLGLPRLGVPVAAGGEGTVEGGGAGVALAHMGISAEASAFMAAAAGLRSHHADGDEDSSSGASVVAIDNKIEQAMDLVKSHLMYAVREEVEVLKEQIKELIERNSQLEQENNLLKNLASPEQMAQFQAQVQTGGSPTGPGQAAVGSAGTQAALPPSQNAGMSA